MAQVRQLTLLQRRPDLTHDEFRKHWLEVHAPLVRKLPGIVSYTQHHVTEAKTRAGYPAPDIMVDGVVEFVFASEEAVTTAFSGPTGQAALADVENFISTMAVLSVTSVPIVQANKL